MHKKRVLKGVLGISLVSVLLLPVFAYYVLSDGFRDYKEYCSGYIVSIEEYFSNHGKFPESLSILKEKNDTLNRYEPEECGYRLGEEGYSFMAPSGFGVVMYFSKTKLWVYD